MKTSIVNKTGDWSLPWTDELIKEAKTNRNNTTVGEQLVLETEDFKVWSIHLPAGKALPFHKHNKPYFYTVKGNGKSRSFFADGKITETEYLKDDVMYFNDLNANNYFTHNLENIGNTKLIFTTVEFKK
ncbi:hypothetical protein [Kordia sp.]|uniref:hypothetical protein n=1 Tax=Kordia sp. TaxID=1965332 RepID=UPI003D29DEF2